jgi:hypothetical protein
MRRFVLLAILLTLCISGIAYADNVSTDIQSVSVTGTISTLKDKAVDMGIFYNLRDNAIEPTYMYTMFHSGTWDILNVGYANPNVLVFGPAYCFVVKDFMIKHNITVPTEFIKKVTDNLTIDFSLLGGIEEFGGKNKFTGGPGVTCKIRY